MLASFSRHRRRHKAREPGNIRSGWFSAVDSCQEHVLDLIEFEQEFNCPGPPASLRSLRSSQLASELLIHVGLEMTDGRRRIKIVTRFGMAEP
jgi:hypothetical protein